MNGRGVFRLADMIGSQGCEAGLPDGRWVRAVPEPYWWGLPMRLRAAWSVATGAAVAVEWPRDGDLERALNR